MQEIKNQTFPLERALYGVDGLLLTACRFEGEEDGESALKEASNVQLVDCYMDLRYPLWHDDNVVLQRVVMTENCRAALWYTQNLKVEESTLGGIKALRECAHITMCDTKVVSPEFGWRSRDIRLKNVSIVSEYVFFQAKDMTIENLDFKGKYSFQYVENVTVENSVLDTKDAFWHSKNVTVKNSVVKGEYLAWYAEDLTFINCKIIGTQPLCYCKNLKLINCTMEGCDFSFEYSEVEADVHGEILSVKNPKSGTIIADSYGEVMFTSDAKIPCLGQVKTR